METKRAQTLEALQTFIQTQRTLLDRTQSDIKRLRELKGDAVAHPQDFLSNLNNKLNDSTFRLSEQAGIRPAVPENIDWTLYDGCGLLKVTLLDTSTNKGSHLDPQTLQTLALKARQKYQPYPYQRSPLSDLQKLVKEARRRIIDPVLAQYQCTSDSDEESEEEVDPEEIRREREREKLRELKKRKIRSTGGLKLPSLHRTRGPSGVFVRRDVEDESHEVDISFDDSCSSVPMDIDTPTPATSITTTTGKSLPPPLVPKINRTRRPSAKLQSTNESKKKEPATSPNPRRKSKLKPPPTKDGADPKQTLNKPKSMKPKPETYKQAWSVSEQHLLEQLLEQIPEGEKNRWQKISRAMEGRRTPRQVASRVQKYFEKLKRFGVTQT
ncbi:hypothetical protein BDZ94DRAFT_1325632 [Collybia nuda]|uniref:ZZ-type zinc finger-containing protein 3 n=1 Tax=Collybia nuda TaxID=64659 RepID=A0A9P5XWW0_9AGAR|nr:hypothetical protein BDZ94DRAFT_1325632 [Collybia nuda]